MRSCNIKKDICHSNCYRKINIPLEKCNIRKKKVEVTMQYISICLFLCGMKLNIVTNVAKQTLAPCTMTFFHAVFFYTQTKCAAKSWESKYVYNQSLSIN